jgi:hypothetical protein
MKGRTGWIGRVGGMKSSEKCGVDKMISRDSEWQGRRVVDFFSPDHVVRLLNLRLGHLTTFPNSYRRFHLKFYWISLLHGGTILYLLHLPRTFDMISMLSS